MKFVDLHKYGPLHRFADYHVYRTLLLLSDGKRRGRKQISESVKVGEGSMRTILEHLREKRMIDVKQTGVKISSRGLDYLKQLPIRLERLEPSDISIAERNVAVLVHGMANRIVQGIEQRDSAIKAGADGATTVIMIGNVLVVPPDYCLDVEKPMISFVLRSSLDPSEGDAIIIGTATDYERAEDGALAAAFALL
jgi:hypothetical protein